MRSYSIRRGDSARQWTVVATLLGFMMLCGADPVAAAGRPHSAAAPTAPAVEEPIPGAASPSAEVTFAEPKRYAVVTELQTKRQRLYGKGDLIPDGRGPDQGFVVEEVEPSSVQLRESRTQKQVRVSAGTALPGGGRQLAETTLLEGLDYRYVPATGAADPEPRVLQIRTRRAILALDAPAPQAVVAAAQRDGFGQAPAPEYALHTQQRLDAKLLGQVRVKGTGRDAYEISAADLRMAMNHGERVLMEAWSAVRPMLSWNDGVTFRVQSPIADGVLGPRGFRVSSPNLAERAGIEVGDVVLAVNDHPVNGFGDVFRLYRQVKQDQRLSSVNVKLERQGRLVTKTYRIR
jgi:hypothetical protein